MRSRRGWRRCRCRRIPIAERHDDYLYDVAAELKARGIRVEIDESDDRMQKKIRNAQLQKVPFMVIAGDDDVEAGAVRFRYRDGRQDNGVPIAEAVERVVAAVASRRAGVIHMGRGAVGVVLLAVLLPALAACGGSDPGAHAPARPPATTPTATASSDGAVPGGDAGDPGADASNLAEAAENLAREGNQPTSNIAPRDGEVLGGDVSWPQCPKGMGIPEKQGQGMPMPLPTAEYVVLGLTNGPGFTPNPCLADQVAWAKDNDVLVAVYAVSSYPDKATLREYGADGPYDASTRLGQLKNVGYQQARFNIGTMGKVGLLSPIVWIDVEPVPVFEWSEDQQANAAVIEGVARGYVDAGFRIGVYSTPSLYERVVGDLDLGGIPEWRAAGQTSRAEALDRCGPDWSIQGGEAVMGQWVEQRRDQNITCPGIAADLGKWFHRFT